MTLARDPRARRAARLVPAGGSRHPLGLRGRARSRTTFTARTTTAPARSAPTSPACSCSARPASAIVCSPDETRPVPRDDRRPRAHRPHHSGPSSGSGASSARASRCERIRFRRLDEFFALAGERRAPRVHGRVGGLSRPGTAARPRTVHARQPRAAGAARAPPPPSPPARRAPGRPARPAQPGDAARLQRGLLSSPRSADPAATSSTTCRSSFPSMASPHWGRLYGRHGFLQYQCVVPRTSRAARPPDDPRAHRDGGSSPPSLAVLKRFGAVPLARACSPFPRPGFTLARGLRLPRARDAALLDASRCDRARGGRRGLSGQGRAHEPGELPRAFYPALDRFRRPPGPQVLLLVLAAGPCRLRPPTRGSSSSARPPRSPRRPRGPTPRGAPALFLTGRDADRSTAVAADLRLARGAGGRARRPRCAGPIGQPRGPGGARPGPRSAGSTPRCSPTASSRPGALPRRARRRRCALST